MSQGIGLAAAYKPGEPCPCADCGYVWPQDPCYEVACPQCGAKAGTYCKRPSEHQGPFVNFHAARDLEADRQGFYDHPCTRVRAAPEPEQATLF